MIVKCGRVEYDLTLQDLILYNEACYQIITRSNNKGFDSYAPKIALGVAKKLIKEGKLREVKLTYPPHKDPKLKYYRIFEEGYKVELTESFLKVQKHPKTEKYAEVKEFFYNEGVNVYFDNVLGEPDTILLHFRSYGQSYTIEHTEDRGFIFCCEEYSDIKSLIDAINKRCRGNDLRF